MIIVFEESEIYLSKIYQRHISNTVCLESKEQIESIRYYCIHKFTSKF